MKHEDIKVRIGLYPFVIKFVEPEEIEGSVGQTNGLTREIKISNKFDEIATMVIIRHEITHALLDAQGRVYQKKFDLEEVCELVAQKLPELVQICEIIHRELFGENYH